MEKEFSDGQQKKSEGKNKIIIVLLIVISVMAAVITAGAVIFSTKDKTDGEEKTQSEKESSSITSQTKEQTQTSESTQDFFVDGFSNTNIVDNAGSNNADLEKCCPICKSASVKGPDSSGYLSCNECGASWMENEVITPNGNKIENPDQTSGNTQQNGNTQQSNNPLNYNKVQLVDYYNAALKKSYSYKLNASKTEQVNVNVGAVAIGKGGIDASRMTKSIIENNTKKNGVVQTKSFVNGKSTDDGTAIQQFILPTNLYADAVKDIKISQVNGGYKMVIKLKPETCEYNEKANYNSSCVTPADILKIDFGMAVTIDKCTLNYTGTVITAMIDEQGRVYAVQTEMPINVSNAQGSTMGETVNVDYVRSKKTTVYEMKFV